MEPAVNIIVCNLDALEQWKRTLSCGSKVVNIKSIRHIQYVYYNDVEYEYD